MTLKEFYQALPTATKDLLFYNINTEIMSSAWTISSQEMINLSLNTYLIAGSKELSTTVSDYLDIKNQTPANLNAANFKSFVSYLFLKYREKWTKLWANVYLQTYNPIWNVEGTDQTVHTFEHGKTTQETRNMTDTHNKGATETTTITSDITNNSRSGFNSSTPVGTDSTSRTGSSNVTGSGNDSDVMTGTDTFTNSGVDTERTTLTRGMNIGVQSTQSLLEQEINLRKTFNYFKIVQNDIINEMTLNIYID